MQSDTNGSSVHTLQEFSAQLGSVTQSLVRLSEALTLILHDSQQYPQNFSEGVVSDIETLQTISTQIQTQVLNSKPQPRKKRSLSRSVLQLVRENQKKHNLEPVRKKRKIQSRFHLVTRTPASPSPPTVQTPLPHNSPQTPPSSSSSSSPPYSLSVRRTRSENHLVRRNRHKSSALPQPVSSSVEDLNQIFSPSPSPPQDILDLFSKQDIPLHDSPTTAASAAAAAITNTTSTIKTTKGLSSLKTTLPKVCEICGKTISTGSMNHVKQCDGVHWSKKSKYENTVLEDPSIGSRVIKIEKGNKKLNKYEKIKLNRIEKVVNSALNWQSEEKPKKNGNKPKSGIYYVYLDENNRAIGCVIAEEIKMAYKVVSDDTEKTKTDTVCCEKEPMRAQCGISRIWVLERCRRQGIAKILLDTVRSTFIYGYTLKKHECAFTQPTQDGKKFATSYFETPNFLVYF